jgi:hypothetical protein
MVDGLQLAAYLACYVVFVCLRAREIEAVDDVEWTLSFTVPGYKPRP